MIKRLTIIILSLLMCVGTVCAEDTVYTVETSKGIYDVVVPEGMTDKDVLLEIAKAYYELDFKYDELDKSSKELANEVKSYVAENQALRDKYSSLDSKYQALIANYKKYTKPKSIVGLLGADLNFVGTLPQQVSMSLGAVLLGKVGIYAKLGIDVTKTQSFIYGAGAFLQF
jgi:hypothetical protein